MFGEIDRFTVLALAAIAALVWHIVSKRRGQEEDALDEQWSGLSYKQRLKNLLEGTPVGYLAVDADGVIREVNQRQCAILGLPAQQVIGRPFWELLPEEERDAERYAFFHKLETETEPMPSRKKYRRPDGRVLTLELYENLLRDEAGRVIGMSFAAFDVTDRQRNEEELYRTTAELKAILEAFPDHFVRIGEDGAVLDYKPGRTAQPFVIAAEPVGRKVIDLVPANVRLQLEACLAEVRRKGGMSSMEYEIVHGADVEHFEVRLLPLNWGEAIAVVRSITEQKQTKLRLEDYAEELRLKNQELEEALQKAQEATRLKSRFLANMSHEIRTPMNGVLGMTEFLLSTPLNEEQREYAESLKSSANSLLTILDDILDISKIEAGKLQIESIPFDLGALVEEVAGVYALRARGKGLEFVCHENTDLDFLAVGDPGRIRQVLNNLLSNALKFTDSGKIELTAGVIGAGEQRVVVRFQVDDTGIGIAREHQQRLFQNFVQGDDSMTRRYGGTGLGLAISKQLVELMGGRIGFQSEPGQGSSFWFTVPLGRHRALPETGDVERLDGIRVLVADRRNSAERLVKDYLEPAGCYAEALPDGRRLAAVLRRAASEGRPFEVALIDLALAQADHVRIQEDIRSDPRITATRLIAMTSAPMRGDGLRVRRAGYSGYLVKPFTPAELRGVIAEVLRRRGEKEPPLVTRHTLAAARRNRTKGRTGNQKAAATVSRAAAVRAPAAPGSGRVLVAEDNPINQKVAVRLLERAGFQVDIANNGREAVEAWERRRYDLILMDCQMPEMDGFEATAYIRSREGNGTRTPICALTAHAMKSDAEKCLAAGMDGYLSKPVNGAKLTEVVTRLIQTASQAPRQSAARA